METTIGICSKDFVLVAADKYSINSIIRVQDNKDKIYEIDGDKLLAASGDPADTLNFGEYIQKNLHLNRLRNQGRSDSPKAAAYFIRMELSEALRKRPYQVNCLLAGWNRDETVAELVWLDYLGTVVETKIACHGYGSHFVLSILDKYYRPDMSLEEGMDLMRRCFDELKTRYLISQSAFLVKVVTKDGIQEIPI